MPDFTPTLAQHAAIHVLGTSVLVSAGAGSGKTAVLAERCARLVADLRPSCPIERLLVVTFTDAAAAQMRQRIGDALRRRWEQTPTNAWLQRQLALLETASISTIHSFCRHVLNRYFAQADLDPQAPVMDANDAALLRLETARKVFDRFGERRDAAGEAFLDFVAAYGGGREDGLIGRVLSVDAFLNSIPDPAAWVQETLERYERGRERQPLAAELSPYWASLLRAALRDELAEQLQTVLGELAGLQNVPPSGTPAIDTLNGYAEALRRWSSRLDETEAPATLDAVCRDGIGVYEFPKAPRRSKKIDDLPESEQRAFTAAADAVRNLRSKLFEKRLQNFYGRFTTTEWAEGIARIGPHVRTFLGLVTEVRKVYQQAKRELGAIDFADLERMTLDLLRDDATGVAAHLRAQYDHVLVDEFQDVNGVQAEILRLVSREGEADRPGNLFAVGDVKQSIYRFRLAEPRLFLDRQAGFEQWRTDAVGSSNDKKTGVVIDLVENFRSRPGVIQVVNAVFERLMARDLGGIEYDEHARLVSPPAKDAAEPPAASADARFAPMELHVLDRARGPAVESEEDSGTEALEWEQIEREAYVIAQRIQDLVAAGTPYGDIVILLRSMKPRAALLLRTLSLLGVPVFADSSGGFFDALEVLDLLSLLALLDNEQQDIPLAALLRSPLCSPSLTGDELAAIRTASGRSTRDIPFHTAVRNYAESGPDETLRARLARLFGRLDGWRKRMRRRPLADVLWEIYEESGYLAHVAGLRDGPQRRAHLIRLHEYARQFGAFKRQGLYRFLQFVNALREAGEDLDAGSVVTPSQDVVRVMTIHRAKGLEFPVVILGELGKRFNLSDARGSILFDRRLGVAMSAMDPERRITYPTLPHRLVSQAAERESLAEELRVLYVALTRAKQRLILVGTASLEGLQRDRQRYSGHRGVVPALDRRTAGSMLDWVSTAVCCQEDGVVAFNEPQPADQSRPPAVDKGAVPSDQSRPDVRRDEGAVPSRHRKSPSTSEPTTPPLFSVHTYDGQCMANWRIEPPQRTGVRERLERCAQFAPIGDGSLVDADRAAVEIAIRRLTTPYAAKTLTVVPAVAAASVLKRRWDTRQDDEEPTAPWNVTPQGAAVGSAVRTSSVGPPRPTHDTGSVGPPRPTFDTDGVGPPWPAHDTDCVPPSHDESPPSFAPLRLREPAFLGPDHPADPAGRGTLTHEFLQRIDLRQPCDFADLRGQLTMMVKAGVLSPAEAKEIDLAGVAWFFSTPLGGKLRSPSTRVLREWPFVMGVDPTRYDPRAVARDAQDVLLVRGIIDGLLDAGEDWEVLDYKTDEVSGEALTDRAVLYRGQLEIYAAAVEAVWQQPVRHRWLVFLRARQVIPI